MIEGSIVGILLGYGFSIGCYGICDAIYGIKHPGIYRGMSLFIRVDFVNDKLDNAIEQTSVRQKGLKNNLIRFIKGIVFRFARLINSPFLFLIRLIEILFY